MTITHTLPFIPPHMLGTWQGTTSAFMSTLLAGSSHVAQRTLSDTKLASKLITAGKSSMQLVSRK